MKRLAVGAAMALMTLACLPAEWGAGAILHPLHRAVSRTPDMPYQTIVFRSGQLKLTGWLFRAAPPRRGLIVYLHGIADNRQSGLGVARHLVPLGFDVFAYDSRSHGDSGGDACTYGYYEKTDLSRALDALAADQAILFGSSLGAAVALQAAAVEPRVRGVVAQSPFSSLRAIVRDRAPWFVSANDIEAALKVAGERGAFVPDEASPERAAARIHVPVLLLHGQNDRETPPAHSERIYAALLGRKRLLLVPGAGHNDVFAQPGVWRVIQDWLAGLPR